MNSVRRVWVWPRSVTILLKLLPHSRNSAELPSHFLSDAGSATIKRYGILNPVPEWAMGPDKDDPAVKAEIEKYASVRNPNPSMVGIAFPGTFILDRQGRVTSRYFEDFYIERNTISSIMMRLNDRVAPVAGTKVSTTHLDITTYPSESAIAPGNRFSIA